VTGSDDKAERLVNAFERLSKALEDHTAAMQKREDLDNDLVVALDELKDELGAIRQALPTGMLSGFLSKLGGR